MLYCLLLIVCVSVGIDTKDAFAQNRFEDYDVWEDPDKQFRLQYPSNWIVQPRENSSDEDDVLFVIDGSFATMTNLTTLGIDVISPPPSADLKETMKATVESTTNSPNNTRLKMKLFEGPEFVKYTVSEKPAGSAIWVYDDPDNPSKDRAVYQAILSIVSDKFVRIGCESPSEQFDKYLPEVERLIQSIYVK